MDILLKFDMEISKMNVLHIIKSFNIGGIEKSTIIYSNHLVNKLNSLCIVGSKGFYSYNKIVSSSIKTFFLPYSFSYNCIQYAINGIHILKIVKEHKFN